MKLNEYLRSIPMSSRKRFAAKAKTTVGYLYQVAGGHRVVGAKLALSIEQASDGKVTRQELRPDIYSSDEAA